MKKTLPITALLWLTVLVPTTTAFAQSKQKPYIANIRVEMDTVKNNVRFKYDLLRVEPEDSIYVQIETADNTFYPKAVQGDIGTNLTPGYDKLFFWDPLADHRRLNEKVNVSFVIRTYSVDDSLAPKRRGLVVTKRQILDYSRWAVSAGLTGIAVSKGLALMRDIKTYDDAALPISLSEKAGYDQQAAALENQKLRFYPWVYVSGASILINAVYSLVRPKPRQTLQRLSFQSQGTAISLAYTF